MRTLSTDREAVGVGRSGLVQVTRLELLPALAPIRFAPRPSHSASSHTHVPIMPLLVITEAQKSRALETMDSGLRHMLEEAYIETDIIAIISHLHAKNVPNFARIETDEGGFRQWCREDIGIEPAGVGRGLISSLVNVWLAARTRVERDAVTQAEARAQGQQPELPRSTQLDLRRSYQRISGELEDRLYPSYAYLNGKLAELEDNELVAEGLDEVTSRQEEMEQSMGDEYDVNFTRRGATLKRHKLVGTLPATTEDLRDKYTIMKHCWGIVRMRHGGRSYLHGLLPEHWAGLLEFVLGPNVGSHQVKDCDGRVIKKLTWRQALHFEHEARRWVCRRVNLGKCSLADGLAAITDFDRNNELMQKYVITPLSTNPSVSSSTSSSSTTGARPHNFADEPMSKRRKKAVAKASNKLATLNKQIQEAQNTLGNLGPSQKGEKGKGSGGKGSGGKGSFRRDSPGGQLALARKHKAVKRIDGVRFCWTYNDTGSCKDDCPFDHVCAHCGAKHSLVVCQKWLRMVRDDKLE
jgi:hypothetical protein